MTCSRLGGTRQEKMNPFIFAARVNSQTRHLLKPSHQTTGPNQN